MMGQNLLFAKDRCIFWVEKEHMTPLSYVAVGPGVMQIAVPIFSLHKQYDAHSQKMGFPAVTTITPLYLSKFTDL